jgi:peroxiredoxin Q/BCP
MRKFTKQLFVSVITLSISLCSFASLSVGNQAPNFILNDQNNITHNLSDYRGSWVILYFYPKDDTPGCTTQACDFRDAVEKIIASRSTVFGVSLDSVESHKRFADKNNLPFSLLSDEGGVVSKAYDSLSNFISFKASKRNTFIIDPEGNIAKIYLSVKPSTHSQMVLNDLNQLQN